MSASSYDLKLAEEKLQVDDGQNETSFYHDHNLANDTDAFLPGKGVKKTGGDDEDVESSDPEEKSPKFTGLTREELARYSTDPKWVKIRWVLFIILLIGWAGVLIIAAIVIVVVEPKCPPNADLKWYQSGVAYHVDVEKFKDSNGDGVGDLVGMEEKVDHFTDLTVESVWIDNVVAAADQLQLRPTAGSLDEFKQLAKTFKSQGIRVVLNMDVGNDPTVAEAVVRHWTDAGAAGFVLSPSAMSADDFKETVTKLQNILDEEFNKKDDRDRVIIGGELVSVEASEGLSAIIYKGNYTCDSSKESAWECKRNTLAALAAANDEATAIELSKGDPMNLWRVLRADVCDSEAICNLVLQLTIPGTPNVVYGDEIGLTNMPRGYMVWDDSATAGFTSNESWVMPNQGSRVESVLAQKSAGFAGESMYSLFKDLAAVRAEEQSLMWGDFVQLDFGDDVFAFVRNATGRAPVLVAVNVGDGKAGTLVFGDYSMGEVLVTIGVDIPMDEAINLSAIYLPAGSALVAKMVQPETE